MGPRPFGRGRLKSRPAERQRQGASMGPRPFGRGRGHDIHSCVSMDTHASMGPRPFGRGRGDYVHGSFERGSASMGPRPFGRGRPVRRAHLGMVRRRFNGAATFRSRKADPIPGHVLRPVHRFNGAATFRSRKVVVARRRRRAAPRFNGAATFRSRKGRSRTTERLSRYSASMGPRPFGRGRSP